MRSFMTMKGYGALMSLVEKWRDIEGYEGLYQVSNMGRVRSLDRKDAQGHHRKGILRKQRKDRDGYLHVTLGRDGKKTIYQVHRLVAAAFISNPNRYPVINHKDENPSNNRVENLEWCTVLYNNRYGARTKRAAKAKERPIYVISGSGHRYLFSSITKAAELLGIDRGRVSACLHGKYKHHHGFSFEWAV